MSPSAAANSARNDVAAVPARVIEAQDERRQVDREGQDPQQRNRSDVLRDVVRNRQQQQRARRRERSPQDVARRCRRRSRRIDRLGHAQSGFVSSGPAPRRIPGEAATGHGPRPRLDQPAARHRATNTPVTCRPAERLHARRHPRLERGTGSRRAPAWTRRWTARTAGRDWRPVALPRTRIGPAGSSSPAERTGARSSTSASRGSATTGSRRPWASSERRARSAGRRARRGAAPRAA